MTGSTTTTPPIALPDRFTLQGEIARGGMAVVYRAHDRHLDRPVAIKVLRAELYDTIGLQRFRREIGVMANLVHPGIVALFDSGETDGHIYYVMPLVRGDPRRERLRRAPRLPMRDAASFGADVAEALAYAHGRGIIHRDVKPENIFVVEERGMLADFGIARPVDASSLVVSEHTGSGIVVGTATYMSPEQATGDPALDERTDLYSLGCVLFELVAGEPPFTARSDLAVLAKHVAEAPRALRSLDSEVSEELDALVMRLLAKSANDRPATSGEVATALRRVATTATVSVVSGPMAAIPAAKPSRVDGLVDKAVTAMHLASTGGKDGRRHLDEAKAYLDGASAIDARDARVLAGLGRWHVVYGMAGHGDRDVSIATGRRLLHAALVADESLAEVHATLGKLALFVDDDFRAAERAARRAVELAPKDPEGLRFLSVIEKIIGRLGDSIATATRATAVAPDLPHLWNALGDALLAAGRNAEAVNALRRAISLQGGYAPALERLEVARVRLGEMAFAVELRVSRLRIGGRNDRAAVLERDAAAIGPDEARRRDCQRELDEMLGEAQTSDPFAEYFLGRNLGDRIVNAYAELGQWHDAMSWVERAYERRPGRLRRILTDQLFDRRGLAVDARYARLLRVAGLEELL